MASAAGLGVGRDASWHEPQCCLAMVRMRSRTAVASELVPETGAAAACAACAIGEGCESWRSDAHAASITALLASAMRSAMAMQLEKASIVVRQCSVADGTGCFDPWGRFCASYRELRDDGRLGYVILVPQDAVVGPAASERSPACSSSNPPEIGPLECGSQANPAARLTSASGCSCGLLRIRRADCLAGC